ncbi:M20 family metallopeptidase [Microvirga sp. W0021]|uniref:M20 family metallopeptidase n=1 Tax=Hohaiivirga grylli TaxID=3133970 RepID=A0ABV0BJ17_9HYPH
MSEKKLPPQHMLEAIRTWVETESPTTHAIGVNAMMDLVEKEVEGLPVLVERFSGRDGLGDTLLLRAGPDNGKKAVLLLAHLDTVHPVGTLANDLPWQIDSDRAYGPGVYDMKASAYIALQAFKQLIFDHKLIRPVLFLFVPDEEIGSPSSRPIIELLGQQSEYVLVTEACREGGKLVTSRKGVGRFDILIEGVPAHSGVYHEMGASAIKEAARQILDLEALTDYERGITVNVGVVNGGSAVNVVPQYCMLTVDLRINNIEDGEEYFRKIIGIKPYDERIKLRIEGEINRPPFERHAEVARLCGIIEEVATSIGQTIGEMPRVGGGSDGNFTAALGIATVDGLGIEGGGGHTLNEYIELSSIEPRRILMMRLLERLAAEAE